MPVFELEESNYAGPIPDETWWPAEVVAVGEKSGTNSKTGEDYTKVEFKFVIVDPDGPFDTVNVWGNTSTSFVDHPDCKLRNWTMELYGVDELPPPKDGKPGFRLDTDDLVAKPCRILVRQREYQKDGQDRIANYVADIMRSKQAMGGAGEAF